MIPDAIFLRLAAGFAHPTPDELVLLKQQQQVMFQEGRNVSLHELALQAGFLTQDQATEFEAIAGGGAQATPTSNDGGKAPSGRAGVKAPSGRAGVKAPSGRAGVKAPSGRAGVKAPSGRASGVRPSARQRPDVGRTGTGRVSARAQASRVSGRQPARSSTPLVPIAVGAVVLGCLAAAVYFSKAKPEDLSAEGPDPADAEVAPTEVGGPEHYRERARALRSALFARLERGQGQRALNELDALIAEWTREPRAADALPEVEALRADLAAELARRSGGGPEADPETPTPEPQPGPQPSSDPEEDPDEPAPPASEPDETPEPPTSAATLPDAPGPVQPDPLPDRDFAREFTDPALPLPKASDPPAGDPAVEPPPPAADAPPRPQDGGESEASAGQAGDLDAEVARSTAFENALLAFAADKDADLVRYSEALDAAKDPLAGAVRGLVAFREGRFTDAYGLLRPAIRVDTWLRDTYLRSGMFIGRFDEVRADMLADPDDVDPTLRTLALGPFARTYPLAAQALERVTPKAHYRVMTDLGLTHQALEELERKLAEASPRTRETLLERTRKKHLALQMLAQTMDKAYAAYDKLFGIDRPCEIVPTVYLFTDSADFAAFSRRLEVGSTENTLGYYLPYYRVLVFYEEGEPKPGELSLETQDTLMHETFHQWLHVYVRDAPPWFNEGLAEYFGHCRIGRSSLTYGLVPAMTGASRLANIRDALTGEGYYEPWQVKRLISADHAGFMSAHPGLNYAQAWSFVHYLASSSQGRDRLRAYFQGLRAGDPQEALNRRVFGDVPAKSLESDWRTYVLKLKPS